MRKQQLIVVLGLFLLLLPLAQASEISQLSLTRNGEPLVHAGSTQAAFALQVNLEVDITLTDNHQVRSLEANVRELNRDPTSAISPSGFVELNSGCQELRDEEGNLISNRCIFYNIPIKPQSTNVRIPLTLVVENETDTQTIRQEIELSVPIDDTNPNLVDIKTDRCHGATCYIASGIATGITITLQDSVGTFNEKNIFYRVGNNPVRQVSECQGSTCTGSYFVSNCETGERTILQLAYAGGLPSTDDAGNAVIGDREIELICDKYKPSEIPFPNSIVGLNITVPYPDERTYGQNYKQGDLITVKALITEDISGVTGIGNFSNLTGREDIRTITCSQDGGLNHTCVWSGIGPLVQKGDGTFYLDFIDGAGHLTEEDETIFINEFDTNVTFTPSFFANTQARLNSQLGYSRLAISIAQQNRVNYPVFADFTLTNVLDQQVNVLRADIDNSKCLLEAHVDDLPPALSNIAESRFGIISVPSSSAVQISINEELSFEQRNKIDIDFVYDVDQLPSRFDVICNVTAIVQEDDFIYPAPTSFELTIPIKLRDSSLGTPGAEFVERIKQKEESGRGIWDFIGTLNRIAATISDLCTIDRYLGTTRSGITVLEGVGHVLQKLAIDPTGNIVQTSNKIQGKIDQTNLNEEFRQVTGKDSGLTKLIGGACRQLACPVDQKWQENGNELFGTDLNNFLQRESNAQTVAGRTASGILNDVSADVLTGINIPDPKESIISAVQSQCYGAVLYHVNQYREIHCNELACLKHFAKLGLDPSVCGQIKSQMVCQAVIGEAYDTIPGTRQLGNIGDNVNALAQSLVPKTINYILGNTVCKADLVSKVTGSGTEATTLEVVLYGLCEIPRQIGELQYNLNENSKTATNFVYSSPYDTCSFAYCNAEDWRDCPGTAPSYLSALYIGRSNGIIGSNIPPNNVEQPTAERTLQLVREFSNAPEGSARQEKAEKELGKLYPGKFADGSISADEDIPSILDDANAQIKLAKDNGWTGADGKTYLRTAADGSLQLQYTSSAPLYNSYNAHEAAKQHVNLNPSRYENPTIKNYVRSINSLHQNEELLFDFELQLSQLQSNPAENADEIQRLQRGVSNLQNIIKQNEQGIAQTKKQMELDGVSPTVLNNIETAKNYKDQTFQSLKQSTSSTYNNINTELNTINNRITEINTALSENERLYSENDCNTNPTSDNCQAITQQRERLEEEKENRELTSKTLVDRKAELENEDGELNFDAIEDSAQLANRIEHARSVQASVDRIMSRTFSLAMQAGLLDWASSENILGNADWYNDLTDFTEGITSDAQQQSTCNAFFVRPNQDSSNDGTQIQCEGGVCRAVLSFAAEKIQFNTTHKLYTINFFVGNVVDQNRPRGEINYNIMFRGNAQSHRLFNQTWIPLSYGLNSADSVAMPIPLEGDYNQMCFIFEQAFPPGGAFRGGSRQEYCRNIVDASTGAAFATGDPLVIQDLQLQAQTSSSEPSKFALGTE